MKRTWAGITASDDKMYLVFRGMVDITLQADPADENKEQCKVENLEKMTADVHAAEKQLGFSGFKTLAVMIQTRRGPHQFAGILPIMDPPRRTSRSRTTRLPHSTKSKWTTAGWTSG